MGRSPEHQGSVEMDPAMRYTLRGGGKQPLMARKTIRLLITDLDNTLYDWVGFFAAAFRAMLAPATALLGVEEEQLLGELQVVHRKRCDSEHPWSLAETASAKARWPGLSTSERIKQLDPAFHAFNRVRNQTLSLYPGVESTLSQLHAHGLPIVGHTEASSINADWRVKRLGLDRYLTRLYTADVGDRPAQAVIPLVPISREIHKPDPRILLEICADFGVEPAEALYVGDSLSRDIAMARRIAMNTAWAQYGVHHAAADWQTLVRITHWTDEDVQRVEATRERFKHVEPDVELSRFDDLLRLFDFSGDHHGVQTESA